MPSCVLCQKNNENVLFENKDIRIIHTNENPLVPGFCRVILNEHYPEMSDLSTETQQMLMSWVFKLEQAMRDVLKPCKINLASFGTMVPHVHWHVIARFNNDAYYPDSIWSISKNDTIPILPENWLEQVQQLLHEETSR